MSRKSGRKGTARSRLISAAQAPGQDYSNMVAQAPAATNPERFPDDAQCRAAPRIDKDSRVTTANALTISIMKPGLVTIDLDGTLVDSIADLHAAVARMQEELGHEPATVDTVRNWVGNGIERLVHRALTGSMHADASPELFTRSIALFSRAYTLLNGTHSSLYPGVLQGLDWLAAHDATLVCVTNKAGQYSRPLLETLGIASYFKHHIAGDDVSRKKPDPAALLMAMKLCNASASKSLMIGDSLHDIRAARAAGFAMIGVSYGYNHGQPISGLCAQDQPDAIVDSFSELPKCISWH